MKHVCMLLAGAGLLAASGTIAAAEDGTTLLTPRLHGDHFICTAINVSDKELRIKISILDDSGQPVKVLSGDKNPTGKVPIPPDAEAEINFFSDFSPPPKTVDGDGYCKVEVSGTDDRSDLRVEMDVHWTRDIPGVTPPTPHLQDLVVQGY